MAGDPRAHALTPDRVSRFLGREARLLGPAQRVVRIVLHLLISPEHFRHLFLPHPINIVINARVELRGTITVFHNVTLGKNELHDRHGAPVIHDGVVILPGAVVAGPITVGEGAVIGANSVVLSDVAPYAVVAGAPARHLRTLDERYDAAITTAHEARKRARDADVPPAAG